MQPSHPLIGVSKSQIIMLEDWMKAVVRRTCFPNGAVRKIRCGRLFGRVYRVSDLTGMSPSYSGAERSHQRAFSRIVASGDTVVDVGANWGLHALYLSALVG